MKLLKSGDLGRRNADFEVLTSGPNIQIASMVLQLGQTSGEYGNEHPQSDQVLYVVEGAGEATVSDEVVELLEGDVLLIAAGEPHQVRGTGNAAFRTLNFYGPPAY